MPVMVSGECHDLQVAAPQKMQDSFIEDLLTPGASELSKLIQHRAQGHHCCEILFGQEDEEGEKPSEASTSTEASVKEPEKKEPEKPVPESQSQLKTSSPPPSPPQPSSSTSEAQVIFPTSALRILHRQDI